MDFSWALKELKAGRRVEREGWNGRGMFVLLIGFSGFEVLGMPVPPVVALKTASGELQLGWLASQQDLLAEDWRVSCG